MIPEDTVELENAPSLDGWNEKVLLAVFLSEDGSTDVLVHSTSFSSPTQLKEKNLTKAMHYQETKRHLPNQTKHVVATSDLLPV